MASLLLLLASATSVSAMQVTSPVPLTSGTTEPHATHVQKLENEDDIAYYAHINVGSQRLKAIVDTGSFELLVFGKKCAVCGRKLYDHSKSEAANVTDIETQHEYGSGTTYSVLAYDKFTVAGLAAETQQFWEVTDADMYILMEGAFQSIFGVGPPASAVKFAEQAKTEVEKELAEMRENGEEITPQIMKTVKHYADMVGIQQKTVGVIQNLAVDSMSFCFGHASGSDGYVIWNDRASHAQPEKFTSLQVVGDLYWSAKMASVKLVHGSAPETATQQQKNELSASTVLGCLDWNCSAVLDTGTSLITAPADVVEKVWRLAEKWEEAGGTCDDLSPLPELVFRLNGQDFALPPESYMGLSSGEMSSSMQKYMPLLHKKQQRFRRALVEKQASANLTARNGEGDQDSPLGGNSYGSDYDPTCSPLLMTMDADSQFGKLWILGMPFFRTYYTTMHFSRNAKDRPQASSMSLSIADEDCKPGVAPGINSPQLHEEDGDVLKRAYKGPRPAAMRVDLSKIRVPSLTKRQFTHAPRQEEQKMRKKTDELDRVPFYRI